MLTRYSLRRSLPLLFGLFALLFGLLLLSIELPRSEREALESWRKHTGQMLALQQSSLADHLRQGRMEELHTELADLGSLEDVRWAAVLDQHQQIIAATRLGLQLPQQSGLDDVGLQRLLASGQSQWLAQPRERFLAVYPLDNQAQHALLVGFDFSNSLRLIQHNTWLFLAEVLALLLVLGIVLSLLYQRLVTRRLALIEQATHQFAAGLDDARAQVTGADEISRLGHSFNHMIEQLQHQQQALRASQQLLSTLIDAAPIGMMVVDQALQVEQANPAAASLFNCSPAELLGNQPQDRLLERDAVKRLSEAPANSNLEFTALRDGQVITLEVSMTPFQRDAREYYLVLLRDISDRKQAEQRLRFLAHFDPLTQLANRNQLLQRLELLVGAGCPLALLFIDIDHFKRINDTLGHEIGDRLLAEIAERLRQYMPANSLLARSGGDEFVCLLEGANADDGKNLGSELLNLFNDPFQVRQYSCNVSPSIGLTLCNGQQGSASDLLKQADLALYAAKDAGRNGLALFTPELSRAAELRQQLEQELRLALEREEFELFYQPQVDASGQAQSMEALLRWRSPSRGLVSPADFIPVLEETGLILEATRWVFRQACRQARRWQSEGRHWRIAVNLSPLDFRQHDLAGQLLQILADEQASAAWLELEITESALLDDGPQVRDCLARLKIAGLPLFLDDFGTGYASLTYLQQFDFDGIKIDRQFVANLPDSPQSVALVRGILTMAAQLGLEVVGEGVENERQAAFLLLNGCQRLQGFYYAKPQPAEVCEQARGFARGA